VLGDEVMAYLRMPPYLLDEGTGVDEELVEVETDVTG